MKIVSALREIVENGDLINSFPGNDSGTKSMHSILADVTVDGKTSSAVALIRETHDGKFQYDLAMDDGRARSKRADGNLAQAPISPGSNQPFQGMNLAYFSDIGKLPAEPEVNTSDSATEITAVDTDKVQAILSDLRTRLNTLMIRNVDLRFDPDMNEQGATEIDRNGEISVLIGAAVNDMNTLNHEAIHVLRTRKLFTEKEWSALEAEARKTWMNDHDIAKRYGDLDEAAQIEEAIAEEFMRYAADPANDRSPVPKGERHLCQDQTVLPRDTG